MQRASITPAESEPGCADTRGVRKRGKAVRHHSRGKTQAESGETSPHIYQNGQNKRSDSTRREARSSDRAQCRWECGSGETASGNSWAAVLFGTRPRGHPVQSAQQLICVLSKPANNPCPLAGGGQASCWGHRAASLGNRVCPADPPRQPRSRRPTPKDTSPFLYCP